MTAASKNSATRPWVDAFADEMEAKLAENRHKGNREGWARESYEWLLKQASRERRELTKALRHLDDALACQDSDHDTIEAARCAVRHECADESNFLMMIADVAGGMKPKRSPDA